MIHASRRPVILAGGGVIAAEASRDLAALARRNSIPVALTLAGLGAFGPDDPLYLGMLGMHGARYTNLLLEEADLLVALGVRFDDRATGKVEEFCRHAAIAHIELDPSEIGKLKKADLAIEADAGEAMRALAPLLRADRRPEWRRRVARLKADHPLLWPLDDDLRSPLSFIRCLAALLTPETIITTDVGQHQMWVAQAYPVRRPRGLQTSGGLGTMGFGLPAAIGAALALQGTRVVCVSGDGSMLMNLQELATLAELNLDVSVMVMNNGHLGLVRQQQELFYAERYHASRFVAEPDFAAIARGFGVRAFNLGQSHDPMGDLASALSAPGPCLVDVPIHQAENVLPMVPPGGANHQMIGGERSHAESRA